MNIKSSGFTLTEMLLALGLSLFFITLLIKIYYWHTDVQHKIDDMIFLDHNGVLAMLILEDNIRRSSSIDIQPNKIILSHKIFYIHQTGISDGLFFIEKNQRIPTEIIPGITKLEVKKLDKNVIKIKIEINAPYGSTEAFVKKIE